MIITVPTLTLGEGIPMNVSIDDGRSALHQRDGAWDPSSKGNGIGAGGAGFVYRRRVLSYDAHANRDLFPRSPC